MIHMQQYVEPFAEGKEGCGETKKVRDSSKAMLDITDIRSPLLTTGEAAMFLGYSPKSINNSRVSGLLGGVPAPKFVKLGRSVRYKKDTLDAWIQQFDEQQNTSQSK